MSTLVIISLAKNILILIKKVYIKFCHHVSLFRIFCLQILNLTVPLFLRFEHILRQYNMIHSNYHSFIYVDSGKHNKRCPSGRCTTNLHVCAFTPAPTPRKSTYSLLIINLLNLFNLINYKFIKSNQFFTTKKRLFVFSSPPHPSSLRRFTIFPSHISEKKTNDFKHTLVICV